MHMHDAFADTEWIELYAPQDAHSFTYIAHAGCRKALQAFLS